MDESEFLDDKSEHFGLNQVSMVINLFDFSLRAEESVACVFVSNIFALTGGESKGGRLVPIFSHSL